MGTMSRKLWALTTLLEQGLGSRLQLLAHSRPPVSEVRWGGLRVCGTERRTLGPRGYTERPILCN